MKYISKSENETLEIARAFGLDLTGGEVVLLDGDLGAGKTVFAKGLALAFGCADIITSPTFTILNEHFGKRLNLYHFDMYRIEDESELKELGFEEFIGKVDGVCAIEWWDKTPSIIPKDAKKVYIKKLGDNEREITIC